MENCLCAIDMPVSYSLMEEDEMTYVEGGGTFKVEIGENSMVVSILAGLGAAASAKAMTTALTAAGVSIATAIELGTGGFGTLLAGAFLIAWGGVIPTIVSTAVGVGINSLKGKQFTIASGSNIPDLTFKI